VDAKGLPQLGKKEIRKGERTFFLRPGESLEDNKVKKVFVLSPEEALLLRALEEYEGKLPGDRWMVYGPNYFIPSVEVEVLEKRSSIPLDKNEGIYVRNIKTGQVRKEMGKSYMLEAFEELCPKDLPGIVEKLLSRDVRIDKSEAAGGALPLPRDKTKVVTLRLPHNSACQVYDYKEKKSRVVFGPDLIALEYDEQFTVLSLSGGQPKQNHQVKSLVLLLGPGFMTDVIQVDTADHAKLQIKMAYKWQFTATKEEGHKLFTHPDFVGDVCKTMASKVRSAVAANNFDHFHKNSTQIIQAAIFEGQHSVLFPTNTLVVSAVDVQSVDPTDQKTRNSLMKSVQLAIEITTKSQEANARHEAERLDQEAQGLLTRSKLEENAKAEKIKEELLKLRVENNTIEATGKARAEAMARTEAARIEAQANVEQAKLKAQAIKIKVDVDLDLQKKKQNFGIEHQKKLDELELLKKKVLTEIESKKFKAMVDAIGSQTISAMARAGPELQAKLLGGLGLKSVMITDGSSPINLFNTANGLVANPGKGRKPKEDDFGF
jgi:major vault protein